MDKETPWKKDAGDRTKVLKEVIEKILVISEISKPIIPETAGKIAEVFTLGKIKSIEPLFGRAAI
jgi:methionyl-tRNA synthetase